MDEKDILEALKMCCDPDNDCHECPYRKMHAGCDRLEKDALDLIIKLQRENESLNAELTVEKQAINRKNRVILSRLWSMWNDR